MAYSLEIEFRGICCFVHRKNRAEKTFQLDVLLPNVTEPGKLRIHPDELQGAVIQRHDAWLTASGASGNPERESLYGREVTVHIPDAGVLHLDELALPGLDWLASDTGSPEDRSLAKGLLEGDFPRCNDYPLLASRIRVTVGSFTTGYVGDEDGQPDLYRFAKKSGTPQAMPRSVLVSTSASGPVKVVMKARIAEAVDRCCEYDAQSDKLRLTIAHECGSDHEARDFVAHYNLLESPGKLTRLPYPIQWSRAPVKRGLDAQCSPVEISETARALAGPAG